MGFRHVELMLAGHNWFPPETPQRDQHCERWFHADGQGAARHPFDCPEPWSRLHDSADVDLPPLVA